MYGVANEGRLGVATKELVEAQQRQGDDSTFVMKTMSLQMVQFPDPSIQVIKVECGSSMTLVLSSDGLLYSWGFGKSGSLGLGEKSNCMTP